MNDMTGMNDHRIKSFILHVTRRRASHRREIRKTRLSITRAFLRRRSIRPTTTITNKKRRMTTTMGVDDHHHRDVLRVKKISEHATIPSRGSDGAAGYDLSRYASDVSANGRRSLETTSSIVIDRRRSSSRVQSRARLAFEFLKFGAAFERPAPTVASMMMDADD